MIDDDSGPWHLDKRIPIALILTIIVQTGAAAWWAASLSERVSTLERNQNVPLELTVKVGKLEAILERVERKLDRLAP